MMKQSYTAYIIVPPGYPASLQHALGLMGSKMLFNSREDAESSIAYLTFDNKEQQQIHEIIVDVLTANPE